MTNTEKWGLMFLISVMLLLTFTIVIFQAELKAEPITRRDLVELRRDMRALRAWFEYDCIRWSERQESYRRRLEQIFGGKPEDIEPTAIIMGF